jgi:hypothetical protein
MDSREFQRILAKANFTEQQYKFFVNLTDPDSPTSGDIVKSYHSAGYNEYSTSKYAAYRLYNTEKMQKVLAAWKAYRAERAGIKAETAYEYTKRNLTEIIDKAKATGDITTWRAGVMDLAKLEGLLIDRHQVLDPGQSAEIDKSIAAEAEKLVSGSLAPRLPAAKKVDSDVIDADFEQKEPENNDQSAEKEPPDDDLPDGWLED